MTIQIHTEWSSRHGRRLHWLGVEGTSKKLLLNDDELAELIRLAESKLDPPRGHDEFKASRPA